MHVFCGVQATGRGHLSRFAVAKEILEGRGHTVYGYATGRDLPPYARGINRFDVGPSFFIRGNRIDFVASFRHNAPLLLRARRLLRDVTHIVAQGEFDEWIIDFEPISARAVTRAKKPFTIFDNQTLALMDIDCPDELRSTQRFMRRFVCAYYGNYAAARRILTYSLLPLEPQLPGQVIVPPCVRDAVRAMTTEQGGHMLFYASIGELPAGLVEFARANPQAEIRAYFSGAETATGLPANIRLPALGGPNFLSDFASCKVYVSNAGFESVAEAVTFRKPMVVVPIGGQAEQRLNASLISSHGMGLAGKDFSRATFERAWHHDEPPAEAICQWVAKGRQGLEAALLG